MKPGKVKNSDEAREMVNAGNAEIGNVSSQRAGLKRGRKGKGKGKKGGPQRKRVKFANGVTGTFTKTNGIPETESEDESGAEADEE